MRDDDYYDIDDALLEEEQKHRFILRIISFALVLLLVSGVVWLAWYAYKMGTQVQDPQDVPLIRADKGPLVEKPEDPGGMQVPFQEKTVYDSFSQEKKNLPKVEKVLPLPEEPVDKSEVISSPSHVTSEDGARAPEEDIPARPAPKQEEIMAPVKAPEKPAAAAKPKEETKSLPEVEDKPEHLVTPPVVTMKEELAKQAPAKAEAKAEAKEEAPGKPLASGALRVQLGSFKETAQAEAAWTKVLVAHRSTLEPYRHQVTRVDLGSRGVFYRLQAGPMANEAEAKAVCEKLKKNSQACILVRP